MKKIVLTGGGTAGHVMPNLALIPELRRRNWEIYYIGSHNGIERELLEGAGIPYYPIATGKLRRYLSFKNLTDPFRVIQGLWQATQILHRLRPVAVFAKGGFVSVPVAIGAWLNRIPLILHESDLTPGLANKIALPFASAICATFPETMEHLPASKSSLTGNPIRAELLAGSKVRGLEYCGFSDAKPVLAVLGGSLGSVTINRAVREVLPDLLQHYQVIHICGKGHLAPEISLTGYKQLEFVSAELPDLLAAADLCLSRAGSNFIFELLALKKPNLLIPLSKAVSRGDQILNANSFVKQGFSLSLAEEELTSARLLQEIEKLFAAREEYVQRMATSNLQNAVDEVLKVISATVGRYS